MRSTARQVTLLALAALAVLGTPAAVRAETLGPAIDTLTNILKEGGDGGSSNAVCVTREGPLQCTGRFGGTWNNFCNTTVMGKTNTDGAKDYGVGSVTFLADGTIEVRLTSSKFGNTEGGLGTEDNPIRGKIDSSGRVLIDRTERDGQVSLRWQGQFQVAGDKAAGGGAFDGKAVMSGGVEVVTTCHGTLTLN